MPVVVLWSRESGGQESAISQASSETTGVRSTGRGIQCWTNTPDEGTVRVGLVPSKTIKLKLRVSLGRGI